MGQPRLVPLTYYQVANQEEDGDCPCLGGPRQNPPEETGPLPEINYSPSPLGEPLPFKLNTLLRYSLGSKTSGRTRGLFFREPPFQVFFVASLLLVVRGLLALKHFLPALEEVLLRKGETTALTGVLLDRGIVT